MFVSGWGTFDGVGLVWFVGLMGSICGGYDPFPPLPFAFCFFCVCFQLLYSVFVSSCTNELAVSFGVLLGYFRWGAQGFV